MGHEVALQFECLDVAHLSGEDPGKILRREIQVLESILGQKIQGIAAHRGFSGFDNDRFEFKPSEYGLQYEARRASAGSAFISDSMKRWPRTNGQCFCKTLEQESLPPRIFLLIHPDFWYEKSYYAYERVV